MALDTFDRLSIKNLLFTKAIPNYVIPVPTAGYKTYPCIDCGDRFLFQSSYEYHVNRQSVVITYMCRHCNEVRSFPNRCQLLSHIRSHAFKTATINVGDLKVDPLPASYFDNLVTKHAENNITTTAKDTEEVQVPQSKPKRQTKFACLECYKDVPVTTQVFRDRAKHFMHYTNKVHTCPVCLFTLPTICGLKAHLRLHTYSPPYYCPECGIALTKRMIQYPHSHDCEGFRMMRATCRYKCPLEGCSLFHPNEYKTHMKDNHIKKVLKCPLCVVACFNETTMSKHLASHQTEARAIIFFQCELCPGRLVLQNQMDNHLKGHITNSSFVYPCWACGQVFKEVRGLLLHYSNNHSQVTKAATDGETTTPTHEQDVRGKDSDKSSLIYRVVKRCDKCKRSFTYKCKYEQIAILPNECPFKCSASKGSSATSLLKQPIIIPAPTRDIQDGRSLTQSKIKCHLCKKEITENWEEVKKHYGSEHKNFRCLDAQLVLRKINMKKYNRRKRRAAQKQIKNTFKKFRGPHKNSRTQLSNKLSTQHNPSSSSNSNQLVCQKCGHEGQDKQMLEEHLVTHRDPFMAYQCMECGQCFVVKPSFTTHLLVEHAISNVDDYISVKQCYNADALIKNSFSNDKSEVEEPLRENQCQICRDQFDDSENLQKHFRVHGMAFLKKNSTKMSSP